MATSRCTRLLRLRRQHVVRGDEPLIESSAQVGDVRLHALERAGDDLLGLACRDERPERARHLEAQVRTRGGEVLAGGVVLCACGALQRPCPPAGVDRPLKVEPGPEVIGNVRIDDPGPQSREPECRTPST